MKRTALWSLVLVGWLITGCGGGSPSGSANPSFSKSSNGTSEVSGDCAPLSNVFSELLLLTNQARAKVEAPPLRFSFQLGKSAQSYARTMATKNFFSHTGHDGSTFVERINATGYQSAGLGENLAAGQRTAQEAFDSWMGSTTHRNNLLNKAFREVGFGLYSTDNPETFGQYWVQHLGKPSSDHNPQGLYIPDSCQLNFDKIEGDQTSVVAGVTTVKDYTSQSNATAVLPAGNLANQIAQSVAGQSNPSGSSQSTGQSVPEPSLLIGLGIVGAALVKGLKQRPK